MFIKKTTKTVNNKKYYNYLLLESVSTDKGPRHKVICSLGNLKEFIDTANLLETARKVEKVLSGLTLFESDPLVDFIVDKAQINTNDKNAEKPTKSTLSNTESVNDEPEFAVIDTKSIKLDNACEGGSIHVAHQMWKHLELDSILGMSGLDNKAIALTEVLTINRLVEPLSEHAVKDWAKRTAIYDIFGGDLPPINDTALYRNLDKLYPHRKEIEHNLAEVEKKLFNLDQTIYLYDLTSTYFEGTSLLNSKAKRGYSRDHRNDCKQVVVGLVLNKDGFPVAHEIFDGNRSDTTTVNDILNRLDERTNGQKGLTVVVDRGMASRENLKSIVNHKNQYNYIVASRQPEREQHLAYFEDTGDWQDIERSSSISNPCQKKSRVLIKQVEKDDELHILCVSDGRIQKDKAIRETKEQKFIEDLKKLEKSIVGGSLTSNDKIYEKIGRLKERYPRVAKYYFINFDTNTRLLTWQENKELKDKAAKLDGGYLLKTNRKDLTAQEVWKTYMLLTRVENAFRDIKGPLAARPVFHQLERRVETHIFICVLAYHLLVTIEKFLEQAGINHSWKTIRKELSSHQIVTASMKAKNGSTLVIRQGTVANKEQKQIYKALKIPSEIIKPTRVWCPAESNLQSA